MIHEISNGWIVFYGMVSDCVGIIDTPDVATNEERKQLAIAVGTLVDGRVGIHGWTPLCTLGMEAESLDNRIIIKINHEGECILTAIFKLDGRPVDHRVLGLLVRDWAESLESWIGC